MEFNKVYQILINVQFDGKLHLISYYIEEIYKGTLNYTQVKMIYRGSGDETGKEDLPIESQSSGRSLCSLNSSERNLEGDGSRLSLRLSMIFV